MEQHSLSRQLHDLANCLERTDKDNEEALQLFLGIWSNIPLKWKAETKNPHNRIDRWKSDCIKVPETVLAQLAIWKEEPLSILTSEATTLLDPAYNFPSQLFQALDHVHTKLPILQAIQSRILQIAFYYLTTKLRVDRLHLNSEAEAEFVRRIGVNNDKEKIRKCKNWATTGGKYSSLARDLGGLGSMICMPTDISRSTLERISSSGEVRQNAIEKLMARGINNREEKDIELCYSVAHKIWEAITKSLDSYFLQYTPSPPTQMKDAKYSKKRKHNENKNKSRSKTSKARPTDGIAMDAGRIQNAQEPYHQPVSTGLQVASGERAASSRQDKASATQEAYTLGTEDTGTSMDIGQSPEPYGVQPPPEVCHRPVSTGLEVPGGEMVASSRQGKPTSSPDPEGTASATESYGLGTNPSPTLNQESGMWNDMIDVEDQCLIPEGISRFWNDMNQVDIDWDSIGDPSSLGENILPSGS